MSFLSRAAIAAALIVTAACNATEREASSNEPAASSTVATAGDVVATSAHAPRAADSMTVTVYKSPTCGCCNAWVDHMRESGFKVVAVNRDANEMSAIKHQHGITNDLGSCHTATVGGYVLEGHVPAADVKRLLAERPAVMGLAVPGMPMGSPGMEGPIAHEYDVVSFDRAGGRGVFASY